MDGARPDQYQPPLSRWGHTWRYLLCLVMSGTLTALMLASASPSRWLLVVDVTLGVLSFALVALRRRWPFAIALLLMSFAAVSISSAGPSTLAAVSLATRRVWRELIAVAAVSILAGEVYARLVPTSPPTLWWVNTALTTTVTATMLVLGMFIGSRRELVWTLRQRAERAEAEQELRTSRARTTERARIAREMHDVLAHRISQVSMRAGALAFREDLSAGELRQGSADIREQANAALTDLRGILGVLRDPETGELTDRPQPTFEDLGLLIEEARSAGATVHVTTRVDGGPVPDQLGRTVYRVVQEGLTNARKHAPGAAVSVSVIGSPGPGINVCISNPIGFSSSPASSAAPGARLGLVGLAERAHLRGGTLAHRREREQFVLEVWLPWEG